MAEQEPIQQPAPLPFDAPNEETNQPLPFADYGEPKPQSSSENLNKLIGTLQSAVGMILALGTFLTATGFVIVNFYLSEFTDIHRLNINPNQYIAAGVGLFVFIVFSYFLFISVFRVSNIFIDYFEPKLTNRFMRRFRLHTLLPHIIISIPLYYIIFVMLPKSLMLKSDLSGTTGWTNLYIMSISLYATWFRRWGLSTTDSKIILH